SELKNLEQLILPSQITDAGLQDVKKHTNLKVLSLAYSKVTDSGLLELKNLKRLQQLNLQELPVTEAGLKELKDLKQLHTLELFPDQVTDAVVRTLRQIGLLHTLDDATANQEKRPSAPAEVMRLELNGSKLTDAGLKELGEFKNLQNLYLSKTIV